MTLSRLEMDLEAKFVDEEQGTISGYGAVFNVEDKGGDVIEPGAFANTLAQKAAASERVPMLWQHDPAQPIGVFTELKEDARGLYVEGRIIRETALGRDAWAMLKHGVLKGLSIGYRTIKAARGSNGERLLKEVELWEISLVTFPMNTSAQVDGVKFCDAVANMTARELEHALRDAGLTARDAKAAVARAMTLGAERDAVRARDAVLNELIGQKLAWLADIINR